MRSLTLMTLTRRNRWQTLTVAFALTVLASCGQLPTTEPDVSADAAANDTVGSDATAEDAESDTGTQADGFAETDAATATDATDDTDAAADSDAVASSDGSADTDTVEATDVAAQSDAVAETDTTASTDAALGTDATIGSDAVAPECSKTADCPTAAGQCVQNTCLGGQCVPQFLADGTPCSDGNLCTAKAACSAGTCKAQNAVVCDDKNLCTTDSCDPQTGNCSFTPLATGAICDDGNPCTQATTCDASGQCGGGKNSCGCQSIKDCAAFDDGDPCNGTLFCNDNLAKPVCEVLPSSVVICDPSNDSTCLQNRCEKSSGKCALTAVQEGVDCDDGNSCTTGDSCSAGKCSPSANLCQCQTNTDCAPFDDGNACNGALYCDKSSAVFACQVNPASVVSCPKPSNPCQISACDNTAGGCKIGNAPDGTTCSDNNATTIGDVCEGGQCVPGTSTGQCQADSDCAKFEDGDFCNGVLFCNKATQLCQLNPKTVVKCPSVDDTACAQNQCDPTTGLCQLEAVNEKLPCSDGNVCTVGEVCLQGTCTASADTCQCNSDGDCVAQDDGNLCNGTLYCDLGSGQCKLNPVTIVSCPTVNDTVCAQNQCVPKTGACEMTANQNGLACEDGNACTEGEACLSGVCKGTSICACLEDADCAGQEDGNLCNGTLFCNKKQGKCEVNPATVKTCPTAGDTVCEQTVCEPASGSCVKQAAFTGAKCDADGNPCTPNDYCDAGVCKPGNNACECLLDSDCAGKQGSDKCITAMFCNPETRSCQPAQATTCDSSSDTPCQQNICDPLTGQCALRQKPDGVLCGEGGLCAGVLLCADGACEAGPPVNCSDADPCTLDACDPKQGCTYSALSSSESSPAPCDDGSVCTSDDACMLGNCVGTATDCSDGGPCTNDACDPKQGCVYLPSTATVCSDDNACTSGDYCETGACKPGKQVLVCDDGLPCTADSCDPVQGCLFVGISDKACDDGTACTKSDKCVQGQCAGVAVECDDDEACTKDSCDPVTGCTNTALTGATCSDNNACTGGDACTKQGVCKAGAALVCNDGNPCTSDECDPLQGCVHPALTGGVACNDGDACTSNDVCLGGQCKGSNSQCDDGNACTKEVCDGGTGCAHLALEGTPCNDGNACTIGDACTGSGLCAPSGPASCDDEDGCTVDTCDVVAGCKHSLLTASACNDGDACTAQDKCTQAGCRGTAIGCDDALPCTQDSCAADSGCVHLALEGTPCNDNNACTSGDACTAGGACQPGAPVDCDDANPCTQDSCDLSAGCKHTALNGTACSDGNLCTQGDQCVLGSCKGTAVNCDDGKSCTQDLCLSDAGCSYLDRNGELCSDNNACTEGDRCNQQGVCESGTPVDCDDSNTCTVDTCSASGGCKHTITPGTACSDGSACTSGDLCNSAGTCLGATVSCDDSKPCTTDSCDVVTGCANVPRTGTACSDGNACTSGDVCVSTGACQPGSAVNCDDANPCTQDSCDLSAGCKNVSLTGTPCSDGNPCTKSDACASGTCVGTTTVCNDGNGCTTDSCGANGECVFTPTAGTTCNDANACTSGDACTAQGACVGATTVNCGTDTSCVDYSCNTSSGCVTTILDGQPCSDGSLCTTGDKCQGSACQGTSITCTDNNPCTTDSCDSASGCKFTAQTGTACSDSNACTTGDSCQSGVCTSSGPTSCDDNNPCTSNLCNVATGCSYPVQNGTECSDGNFCTVNDLCTSGNCGGTTRNCDDGKLCTTDSCINTSGCSNVAATGATCDDGNACTGSDKCTASAVCAGTTVTCNDNNPCTVDSCSTLTGCTYTNIQGAVCDDGLFCTVSDACNAVASCVGQTRNCDEGNLCTTNTCNEATDACTSSNNTLVCSDGNPCTINDQCSAGSCVATPKVCDDANDCTTDACQEGNCVFDNKSNGTSCDTGQDCSIGSCQVGTCLLKSTYWKQSLTDFALASDWAFDVALENLALTNDNSIYLFDQTGTLQTTVSGIGAAYRQNAHSGGGSAYGGTLAPTVAVAGVGQVVVASNRTPSDPSESALNWYSGVHLQDMSGGMPLWTYSVVPSGTVNGVHSMTSQVRIVGGYVIAWGYLRDTGPDIGNSKLWLARIPLTGPTGGTWYVEFNPISQTTAVNVEPVFFESDGEYIALRAKYLGDSGTVTTAVHVRSFANGSAISTFTPLSTWPMVFQSGATLNARGERWIASTGAFIGKLTYQSDWVPSDSTNGVVIRDRRDGLTSIFYNTSGTASLRSFNLATFLGTTGNSSITTSAFHVKGAKALSDGTIVTWGVDDNYGNLYALRTDAWLQSTCTKCFALSDGGCVGDSPCEFYRCSGTASSAGCAASGDDGTCSDGVSCTADFCNLADNACRSSGSDCNDGDLCTTSSCQTNNSCGGGVPVNCDDGNSCTLDACNALTGCSHTPLLIGMTCTTASSEAGYCGGTSAASVTCSTYVKPPSTTCWTTLSSTQSLSSAATPGTYTGTRNIAVATGGAAIEWVRIQVQGVRSNTTATDGPFASIWLAAPGGTSALIGSNWTPTSTSTSTPSTKDLPDSGTTVADWTVPVSTLGTSGEGTWGLRLRNDGTASNYFPRLYGWTLSLGYKCPSP